LEIGRTGLAAIFIREHTKLLKGAVFQVMDIFIVKAVAKHCFSKQRQQLGPNLADKILVLAKGMQTHHGARHGYFEQNISR